jgi:hypothetical protein
MLPTFILSFLIIPFNFSVPHDFILQLLFILYFTYTLLCMLWVFLFSNLSYLVSWSIIFRISSSLMLWKITQDFPSLLCVFHESNYRNEMAKKANISHLIKIQKFTQILIQTRWDYLYILKKSTLWKFLMFKLP